LRLKLKRLTERGWLAEDAGPRPRAWAAVISGSTRTASRPAEMSVADIGGHRRSVAPGEDHQ
jgi:hypothetical protein